jgi:multiple sugar transport system substrate-binding protein
MCMTDRSLHGGISRRSFIASLVGTLSTIPLLQACSSSQAPPSAVNTTAPAAAATAAPKPPATTAPAAATTAPAATTEPVAAATTAPSGAATTAPAAAAGAKPFAGTTIRYAGLTSMGSSLVQYSQDWLDQQGITVQLSAFDQQGLPTKIVEAAATHTYLADLVQLGPNESIALKSQGYLDEVPASVLAQVSMDEVLPIFSRLLGYGGKIYALPYDGDDHMMAFRGDLFSDPQNQAKFKAKYGYDMDPVQGPKDWVEHANYAEFFTGTNWNNSGQNDAFGFSHMTKRNDTLFWGFFSRAAGYAKHPDDPGFFFDTKTFKPRINSPAFLRAATEWRDETNKWSPPGGATQAGWSDVIQAYVTGRTAMCVGWGDHGTNAQDTTTSIIKGKSRYAMTPGSKEVYNSSSGQWETLPQVNRAPFIAYGGWNLQMPKDSKQKDAAWAWGAYCASLAVSNKMVTLPSGANPLRKSQLSDVSIWTDGPGKWDKDEAASYMKAVQDTITHPNLVADLRISGFFEYVTALELGVSQIMAGQGEPQKLLDDVADAWTQISNKFGADKQKALYLDALGVS